MTVLVFEFCYNLIFLVLSQFEFLILSQLKLKKFLGKQVFCQKKLVKTKKIVKKSCENRAPMMSSWPHTTIMQQEDHVPDHAL